MQETFEQRIEMTEFPSQGTPEEQFRFALGFAVLAPSGHNSQPWRFHLEGDRAELWLDAGRTLPVVDPSGREAIIACGASLFCLRLALAYFGRETWVTLLPDARRPFLLAQIRLGATTRPSAETSRLFRALPERHTNRLPFEDRAVSEEVLTEIAQAAAAERAAITYLSAEHRARIQEMIAEGNRIQESNPAFRKEIAGWIRPNQSAAHDGIPGHAVGIGDLLSHFGPFLMTFDMGDILAVRDRHLAEHAPTLAVLTTGGDTSRDWLQAGQALARLWLTAQASEVALSFFNQPIEVRSLRAELQTLLGGSGSPQMLFRLGYGPHALRSTPRRSVEEVLV